MQVTPAAKNKTVEIIDLGLIDYKEAWDFQEELFAKTVARKVANRDLPRQEQVPTANHLIFCSHPHVYTLGKSGKPANLLVNDTQLQAMGATYYPINRGGDITYHGPGQIVVYPILDLDNFFTDIHRYLRLLEEAVILTLRHYGLAAGRIPGLTGVWLDHEQQQNPRKICAIGVKASRWVTMHGLAFNVNTDLSFFNHIVPCGIDDKAVTSLEKELGHAVPLPEVQQQLLKHLTGLFEMDLKHI